MLVKRGAQRIANWCCAKEDAEDNHVVQYGIELFLENLVRVIGLVVVGVLFRWCVETICFLLIFPLMRMHAGGIHAKTSWGCTTLMFVSIAVCVVSETFSQIPIYLSFCINLFNNVLLVFLAPNGNIIFEQLDDKYYKKKKKYAIIINNALWMISVFSGYRNLIIAILSIESMSLLAYKIQKERWKNHG